MKTVISLNGKWDFVADLDPKYHNDTGIHGRLVYAGPEVNRRHWKKVPVPGVWQSYDRRYEIFEGVCWFAREFELDSYAPGTPARLRFGAVNYLCRVFLNGEEIGGHETGYTEFIVDASGHLKSGRNHIAVMVDNRALVTRWPPCLGYFNYGGIHRDVTLEILEGAWLDHHVAMQGDWGEGGATLNVSGEVRGDGAGAEVTVACLGESARLAPGASGRFACALAVPGAAPWSPEAPALYEVALTLKAGGAAPQRETAEVGFKRAEVKQGKFLLNGAEYPLKGVCYVYDSPSAGLVMEAGQLAEDVALMKEMGCNAVRCHYPMDGRFYSLCDRAGLMVWVEPMVYCYHPETKAAGTRFSDPQWLALAGQIVEEMIGTARSHVSVTIYGIGNECNTANAEAEAFFTSLAQRVRRSDPARLISYAALYGLVGPLARLVDILGVNSYFGWYDKVEGGKGMRPADEYRYAAPGGAPEPIDLKAMREMLGRVIAEAPESMALLLTEFGADSISGYYSGSRDLWSEEYHSDLLGEVFRLRQDYPQIVGTFPFCFSDYRDPSKFVNGYWDEVNLKGMVTYERRKKLAFAAVKRQYLAH